MICLAALSNDPLGDLNPGATVSVNLDGTLHLAEAAKAAGVERFLFASSCSLYGAAGSDAVAEDADLYPVTPYGETKVQAERALSALADDDFSPTYLRNATAYGASPRLRLDIVVNNLTAVAMTTGQVRLESDGTPWRPLVHIEDISRAFLAMLEAPRELVHNEAFNVGRAQDNVQIRQIAEMVRDAVPGSTVSLRRGRRAGPAQLPGRLRQARRHLPRPEAALDRAGGDRGAGRAPTPRYGLTHDDFTSSRFVRLRRIRELLDAGAVDEMLRRSRPGRGLTQPRLIERDAPRRSTWPVFSRLVALSPVLRRVARRFGWGLADQAMSSVSNAAVSFYVARELGAAAVRRVQPRLRHLLLRAQRLAGPGHRPAGGQVQQRRTGRLAARGGAEHRHRGDRRPGGRGCARMAAAMVLHGTPRLAFLALGLTLPGLLLQDSWRYAFFAVGRGSQAFLNDTVWTLSLLPALVLLRVTHHGTVFWFVLAWGAAATVAACVGPLQARVLPRLASAWTWVSHHRDLGPRYLAENAVQQRRRPAAQLRRRHHRGPGRGRLPAGRPAADGPVHGRAHGDIAGHGARGGPGTASLAPSSRACTASWSRSASPSWRWPGERSCWWRCRMAWATCCSAASGSPPTRWWYRSRSASWARASRSGPPRACMPSAPPAEACGR